MSCNACHNISSDIHTLGVKLIVYQNLQTKRYSILTAVTTKTFSSKNTLLTHFKIDVKKGCIYKLQNTCIVHFWWFQQWAIFTVILLTRNKQFLATNKIIPCLLPKEKIWNNKIILQYKQVIKRNYCSNVFTVTLKYISSRLYASVKKLPDKWDSSAIPTYYWFCNKTLFTWTCIWCCISVQLIQTGTIQTAVPVLASDVFVSRCDIEEGQKLHLRCRSWLILVQWIGACIVEHIKSLLTLLRDLRQRLSSRIKT